MGDFNATLGALLLAVIINTYLYGIVTFQYASYYTSRFQDARWIKCAVLAFFISDTFHSICIIYMAWIYAVEDFANPSALTTIIWPFPLSAIMMTLTAYLTQLFLSYRILLLLRSHILYAALIFLATGSFAAGMIVGVKVWLAKTMLNLSSVNKVLTAWLSSEVVVDISIAAILLYTLHRSSTGFKQSDKVLKRLARTSVQTGVFSAIFALLTMILFLAAPGTQYYLIFGLPISRVYTSTLMDTLLGREALRQMINKGSDAYCGTSLFGVTNIGSVVHVQREVVTDIYLEDAVRSADHTTSKKSGLHNGDGDEGDLGIGYSPEHEQ